LFLIHWLSTLSRLCDKTRPVDSLHCTVGFWVYSVSISIMHIIAKLAALAVFGSCIAESHQSPLLGEPAFGIEFSLENIKISFAPPNGSAKGLASIKGGLAYQDLMYSYFELCYWASGDQVPPQSYEDNNGTSANHAAYVAELEGIDNLVSWRWEAYPNETDVDILADAVRTIKSVATGVLADEYNITIPERPLVALAAPNFMWTMTEVEFWDGGFDAYHAPPYEYGRDAWYHGFALKMADAVREAGFRLEPFDANDTAIASRTPDQTFPIAPAAHAAFWNPDFAADANLQHLATNLTIQYEGPPAIVFELTNATLSFWAHEKNSVWSPWFTMPQLGTHIRFGDLPGYMYSPDDWVWNDVMFMIKKLRYVMGLAEGEGIVVYLTGDVWEEEMVRAFGEYLGMNGCGEEVRVVARGAFAGSDGAAVAARELLDASPRKT
jgi:hypothetical protein